MGTRETLMIQIRSPLYFGKPSSEIYTPTSTLVGPWNRVFAILIRWFFNKIVPVIEDTTKRLKTSAVIFNLFFGVESKHIRSYPFLYINYVSHNLDLIMFIIIKLQVWRKIPNIWRIVIKICKKECRRDILYSRKIKG